jgi:hypothetical protein
LISSGFVVFFFRIYIKLIHILKYKLPFLSNWEGLNRVKLFHFFRKHLIDFIRDQYLHLNQAPKRQTLIPILNIHTRIKFDW